MEENYSLEPAAEVPDTTPEADAATPETPESGEPAADTRADGDAGDGKTSEPGTGSGAAAPPAFTVPVKYNKQYRELTPDEASVYAQKGMKYESLEPHLAKLRLIGQQTGLSLEKILDGVYQASEDLARKRILEEAGGNQNLANKLMEARQLKNKSAYDAMLSDVQRAAERQKDDNNQRLAAEFQELRAAFPALSGIDDLPDSVLQAALRSGRDLLSEYLRYQHTESRRVKQAEAQGEKARNAAVGSLAGDAAPDDTPALSAMLKGVWS